MIEVVLLGDRNPQFLTHRELDAAVGMFPGNVSASWVSTDRAKALQTGSAECIMGGAGERLPAWKLLRCLLIHFLRHTFSAAGGWVAGQPLNPLIRAFLAAAGVARRT
jgi:hypothetical protein